MLEEGDKPNGSCIAFLFKSKGYHIYRIIKSLTQRNKLHPFHIQ